MIVPQFFHVVVIKLLRVDADGGFRLVSRDSTGGIELSSYSRALTVWEGDVIRVKVGKLS
jgi:hypothetical protein